MRVAVTYENEEIFGHFGHTKQLKLYDIKEGNIVKEEIIDTNGQGHGALVDILVSNSVDTLICGGIGAGAINALKKHNIKLFGGVSGKADEAVKKLLDNTLEYNDNPHCEHHNSKEHSCNEDKHGCSGH